MEQQEYEKAVADFSYAIALQPDLALAYYNRGIARYQLEKVGEGKEDLEKAAGLYKEQGQTEIEQQVMAAIAQLENQN
ncbi:MAG: tetratricopeptide repeat protein [Cyanobacteria bacterium SBLK]|nr:tetratricopeptide repeat protein [Cyanobacteria bacterium SBLK]